MNAPEPRNFCFLVNPASGGGAAPGAVVPVASRLRAAGARVEVTYSPGPAATRSLVEEAVGRGDVVVAVGGDGMLSSLVGTVAGLGGTLGIVPAGRGNDFARMVGLPADPDGLAEVLLHAPVRPVDLLAAHGPAVGGDSTVAGSVYAGVDARAAAYVHAMKRVPRRLHYPVAAVRALATYTPVRLQVDLDGAVSEYEAATVVVANSGYYGNGMKIAPAARVDDGTLDVVVIEAASRWSLIRSLPKVYDGGHVVLPEVTVLAGKRVELRALAGGPVPVGGDGEPFGHLGQAGPELGDEAETLRVEVCPGVLRLIR